MGLMMATPRGWDRRQGLRGSNTRPFVRRPPQPGKLRIDTMYACMRIHTIRPAYPHHAPGGARCVRKRGSMMETQLCAPLSCHLYFPPEAWCEASARGVQQALPRVVYSKRAGGQVCTSALCTCGVWR